jgi:hypothetical protein
MAPYVIEVVPEPCVSQQKLNPIREKSSACLSDITEIKQNDLRVHQAKNPSLQVTQDHKIKMVDAPVPTPGPGEVLLHIKATGICG